MCVLTYLPTDKGFILTNNRDEHQDRSRAISPQKYEHSGKLVTYPKDPLGGGTWMACSEQYSLCLLNGGKVKHQPSPPYRASRGKVITDFFKYEGPEAFLQDYPLKGMEPFTVFVFSNEAHPYFWVLCHDIHGALRYQLPADKPYIWSSATLYSPEIIRRREAWFEEFLSENPHAEARDLLTFHKTAGDGDPENQLKMKRDNGIATLAFTQVICQNQKTMMSYHEEFAYEEA